MGIKIIKANDAVEAPVSHNPAFLKKVILKNGDITNLLQLALSEFDVGDVVEEHVHASMCEIFIILKGALKLISDGAESALSEGDVFVINPRTRHKLIFTRKSKLIYFGMNS